MSKKIGKVRGAVRDNLEALTVALMAAVLMKYFAIEAFQIPTSSMQPTLMGSSEAGVHSRILVDKITYEFSDPKRWDVSVFRYPLQQDQNYVKRILGIGGDSLRIAGGNVYQLGADKAPSDVLRKPDRIQPMLWKELFPRRMHVRGETDPLDKAFRGTPGRAWTSSEETLTAKLSTGQTARLRFVDRPDGGFVNRVWDGYPIEISKAIRDAENSQNGRMQDATLETVVDGRIRVTITSDQEPTTLQLALEVQRPATPDIVFALEVAKGRGTLVARVAGGEEQRSDPFDFAVPAGAATEIGFLHRDDMMRASLNGVQVAEFDTTIRVLDGLRPDTGSAACVPTIECTMAKPGNVKLAALTIDRDLHYTWRNFFDEREHVINVPEGHYFMMGDNTLQSVDSRGWTAIEVGRLPDGSMVNPATNPEAQVLRGNKRPVDPTQPVDRDETPIALPDRDRVSMLDDLGNVWPLKSKFSPHYLEGGTLHFRPMDGGGDWSPVESKVSFVPKEHMLGRALLGFWPFPPFGHNYAGFIR